MKRILKLSIFASRRRSSRAAVSSSLTSTSTSPVSGSTMSWAATLRSSSSGSTGMRSSLASFILRMAARVNLVFFLTRTSAPSFTSRVARWPARSSYSMLFEYLSPFSM